MEGYKQWRQWWVVIEGVGEFEEQGEKGLLVVKRKEVDDGGRSHKLKGEWRDVHGI